MNDYKDRVNELSKKETETILNGLTCTHPYGIRNQPCSECLKNDKRCTNKGCNLCGLNFDTSHL